jgi:acylphosphatase
VIYKSYGFWKGLNIEIVCGIIMKRVHLRIFGRVQGVSFRYYVKKFAGALAIGGHIKNLDDGSVEVVAEGDESNIKKLIEFCRRGPEWAHVESMEVSEEAPTKEFKSFEIRD